MDLTRAALAESEGRLARVEGGFNRLASMVSDIQDAVHENLEARASTRRMSPLGRQGRRRRQESPPRADRESSEDSRASSSRAEDRRRRSRTRSKSCKRSEFAQKNFVEKSVKIDSLEALMLVNIRTVAILLKQGEDIHGLIDHIELICEKALTRVYRVGSLIAYDKCVRTRADDKGPSVFGQVFKSDVLRHFSYDSTIVAASKVNKGSKPASNKVTEKRPCFRFNSTEGCVNQGCKYSHSCMFCRSSSHGSPTCNVSTKSDK